MSTNRTIRRSLIKMTLRLMHEGGHFRPESNMKLSVIKKYVRFEEVIQKSI